jgi:hypothetical protein
MVSGRGQDIIILKSDNGRIKNADAPHNSREVIDFLTDNNMYCGKFNIIEQSNENEEKYYIIEFQYEYIEDDDD